MRRNVKMQFISSKLKKFDVHRKTTDAVKDQTLAGAVITVLSFIIIGLLLHSNIAEYFKTDRSTRMILDKTVGIEDVKLVFNVSFYFVPCKGQHDEIPSIGIAPRLRLTFVFCSIFRYFVQTRIYLKF